jgi:transketolase
MNGMALHGGLIPAGGTFFTFSDYMRGSVRLAAISDAKVIYFWTHDSVGLGQDGPTHQPIEQLAAVRAIPNLRVIRPADANESAHALRVAIERNGPTALILSRQDLPVLEGTAELSANLERGAYVLVEGGEEPDLVLVGTGSEVSVCVGAAALLEDQGIVARVVSMPSWELFDEQDDDYQDSVLGPGAPVLAVEAASSFGWARWADDSVSIDHFGASGPGAEVLAAFGFTPEHVAARAATLLDTIEGYDDFEDDEEDEL